MSRECRSDGRCTAKDGTCVPGAFVDCLQSELCRKQGRCRYADGQCVEPAKR